MNTTELPIQPLLSHSQPANNDSINSRSMLLGLIQNYHTVYHIEHRDRPNVLARVLLSLHDFDADQNQLTQVYHHIHPDLEPLQRPNHIIHQENWQEFLGNHSSYGDYLVFFDQEIQQNGIQATVDRYFYRWQLYTSIGSQLQPLVHLAFGLEQQLPEIVSQGLAYLACSYLDVSELLLGPPKGHSTNTTSQILFDLINADQRFDGRMDGSNTFCSAAKLLLKSKPDLLRTYMAEWVPPDEDDPLTDLIQTARRLIHVSARHTRDGQIHLDWFLGGGQLLASALAIRTLATPDSRDTLLRLQYLATICTYVIQGRPKPEPNSTLGNQQLSMAGCIQAVVASGDPKAILIIQSLVKLPLTSASLDTANFIVAFLEKGGIWVKPGTGWASL
ncbi:hypothetical protein DFQ28_003536 [Apophysomyces sp. BC1034]|nr:hypothetical protein DFQ30_009242 [Apophysomyces sp. BC1015]KAG0179076.1 hypothetical protein DFQ29_002655 [Apophysomyces sp. BC1021]KAG0189335.1 hypothetical protein DFQ28_003536 [Apophysomyces sp. BC1034]